MRIDRPTCNLKTCRNCFDGNCLNKAEYEKCDYALLKSNYRLGKFVELPCSLGDIAYVINPGDFSSNYMPFIEKSEIYGISQILLWDGTASEWGVTVNAQRYPFSSLGKTWFLDKFDAEERLEKIIYGN